MRELIRRSWAPALLAFVVAFGTSLCTSQALQAQTRNQIGAAGAVVLGQEMGVPDRVIRSFDHDALTVEGSWTNGRVTYRGDGIYSCRFAAAMALATAASRSTDLDVDVYCPDYRVDVALDVGYGGNVSSLRVVQYRRSDGEIVWRHRSN